MKIVKVSVALLAFGCAPCAFSQAVAPVAPQPAAAVDAQAAQLQAQAEQLRAQAAELQAQAARLQAQAQAQARAAQVGATQAVPVQPQANPLAGLITMADAKRIALATAGIAETAARNFKVELDHEGPLMVYEVEFNSGIHEYEYKIDARSGTVIGTKKKVDLF